MNHSLRNVRDDEKEWLYELNKESYYEVVVRQFGEWEESLQQKMFFTKWQRVRNAQVIEHDAKRIGIVILEQRERYDWLEEIQVQSDHQGRGLGTALLDGFIADARSRGRPLRLQVLHENHRAMRLYERIGFLEIEKLENHYLMEAV